MMKLIVYFVIVKIKNLQLVVAEAERWEDREWCIHARDGKGVVDGLGEYIITLLLP